MSRPQVLVVEDSDDIQALLQAVLTPRGFDVQCVEEGKAMDRALEAFTPDLILLDGVLPGESGFSICKRLFETGAPPVIMVTSRDEQHHKNTGLSVGAADYVTKPFDPDELVLRMRSVLRRNKATVAKTQFAFFDWSLDLTSRILTSPSGKSLLLSSAEFALLSVFLRYPERPLRREFISEQVQKMHGFSTAGAMNTLVSRLRSKLLYLDDTCREERELIQTAFGIGYMLRPGLSTALEHEAESLSRRA